MSTCTRRRCFARVSSGLFILALTFAATASPVEPGQVEVIDGDTIRIGSETFRLIGFDTPETYRAQFPRGLVG